MKEPEVLQKVTENIFLGKDGKYHWYYEFKMLKNPTILKLLWKIFFWIFVGIWVFMCILEICNGDLLHWLKSSWVFLLVMAGFEVLVALGYFIYAAVQGFRYCVIFDMNWEGVTHTQMPKQFRRAQALSLLTILAGAAGGKPGVVGTGILSATKQSMRSTWSSVRSVEIDRKREVIKVNERMNRNQVYAKQEDFEFVENFIRSHVPAKCRITVI